MSSANFVAPTHFDRASTLRNGFPTTLKSSGRAAEGWEFYERQYDSPDREDVKAQVRKALASDPVYRAITRRGRRAAAARD